MRARIGLIFGGRSTEHRVSMTSARTVARGLEEAGHEVVPLGIARDGSFCDDQRSAAALDGRVDVLEPLTEGEETAAFAVATSFEHLIRSEIDVAFPIAHGTWGEDGSLQGLLEMLSIPYVGAGVTASAVAMDKALTKRVLADSGIPVVDGESIAAAAFEQNPGTFIERCERLPWPRFVKPSAGGSSVGVRRVESATELEDAVRFALQFDRSVLVEAGITGREIECAVLGRLDGGADASVLGEIVSPSGFYDYEEKYLNDSARLIAPVELPDDLADRLRSMAVEAFLAIGCEGMARVDFLVETVGDERVFINEINTLPGFTDISMYPRLWELSGVALPKLVDRLVALAIDRHQRRLGMDSAISEWIQGLESA